MLQGPRDADRPLKAVQEDMAHGDLLHFALCGSHLEKSDFG